MDRACPWLLVFAAACNPGTRHDTSAPDACVDGECTACTPNRAICLGDGVSRVCNADGSATFDETCDPALGMQCDVSTGRCITPCAPDRLGRSYIGCDYYPTVVANTVSANFAFAVAVANTWTDPAIVTIDGGDLATPLTFEVAPGKVGVQSLPWVPALKTCVSTGIECEPTADGALARKGGYHLRSTRPVTVYQFNPLEYHANFAYSTTNDASLLLPTNALGSDYVVASWPAWTLGWTRPGVLAITATEDATEVTVTTTTTTIAGGGAPAFTAGMPGTVTLDRGDVLELLAFTGDLTGTRVQATHPVQVIGGHFCTQVPLGVPACDHLEDAMFPIDTLARDYVVAPPLAPGFPAGRQQVVRIVAAEGPTTLVYDPPINAPTVLAARGAFVEIPNTTAAFRVTADRKILVAQYMTGQGDSAGAAPGDPSLALAVTVDQFRSRYVFLAPTTYDSNDATVIAPMSTSLMLDGIPIGGLSPIGTSGLGVTRVQIPLTLDGRHELIGDRPFGLSVYGYGAYTSYWYPGGLDLEVIL